MSILKQLILAIIILFQFACENKNYSIVFTKDALLSEILVPPSGCNKVRFLANGTLYCEGKLELFMDSHSTNFVDHVNLSGVYENKEIYASDWYENNMLLRLISDSCIVEQFNINVVFYN